MERFKAAFLGAKNRLGGEQMERAVGDTASDRPMSGYFTSTGPFTSNPSAAPAPEPSWRLTREIVLPWTVTSLAPRAHIAAKVQPSILFSSIAMRRLSVARGRAAPDFSFRAKTLMA